MEVELKPGEEICPQCEGTGEEPGKFIEGFRITCHRCWGDGKLDWIEMAMGKPNLQGNYRINPCAGVDLYHKGRKILETTKEGMRVKM